MHDPGDRTSHFRGTAITGNVYLNVFEQFVFPQDCAPLHYSLDARLIRNFQTNGLVKTSLVLWLPRSPVLTSLDYFFGGFTGGKNLRPVNIYNNDLLRPLL